MEFIRPVEDLERTSIALLTCRSEKKKRHLQNQAEAARKKIAEFSKRWQRIAAHVARGKAGVRDERHFNELALLLSSHGGDFSKDRDEVAEGRRELMESAHAEAFLSAACDPRQLRLLTLASVMTRRLSRHHQQHSEEDYEQYAVGCTASGEFAEQIAEDPAEATKLFAYLNNKAISVFERTFTGKGQSVGDTEQ